MPASKSTKERLGKAILWIGVVGFFVFFAANFVMDDVLLKEPLVREQATGNTIEWKYKGYTRFITESEDFWQQHLWEPTFLMFCLVAIGAYLTPKKSER